MDAFFLPNKMRRKFSGKLSSHVQNVIIMWHYLKNLENKFATDLFTVFQSLNRKWTPRSIINNTVTVTP